MYKTFCILPSAKYHRIPLYLIKSLQGSSATQSAPAWALCPFQILNLILQIADVTGSLWVWPAVAVRRKITRGLTELA